jgi:hypothetical protein
MSGRPPAVLLESAVAVAEIVVQLHEAQRGKAVEPGVGHRLQGVGKAVALDAAHEAFALLADLAGHSRPAMITTSPLRSAGRASNCRRFREAEQVGALGDGGDEVLAGLGA